MLEWVCIYLHVQPVQLLMEELWAFSWPAVCHHLPAQLWPAPETEMSPSQKSRMVLFLLLCASATTTTTTNKNRNVRHVPRSLIWAGWSFCRYKMEPLQHAQPSSLPPVMFPKSYHASSESSWNLWNSGSTKAKGRIFKTRTKDVRMCIKRHLRKQVKTSYSCE